MKKMLLTAVTALILAVTSGCSDQNEQANAQAPSGQGPQQQAPMVSVATLSPKIIDNTVTLPGRVSPLRQSQVRPQVEGVIVKRLFKEGAIVEQGQQLYQIDDARYAAQLASAKADLKSVQATLKTQKARSERFKNLLGRNAVSQQEYDDALADTEQTEAQIGVAKAAIDLAEVNLEYTKVYAPISGQISRSFVTVGGLVTANQTQHLATITQLDPIYVDMQQSGSGMLTLRRALKEQGELTVSLILDDVTGQSYEHDGKLQFSEVTVDETTGAVALRAEFPNPESLLMPGMFVKAQVLLSKGEQLLVPQRAATRQPDGSLQVMTVDSQNKVAPRKLETSDTYQDQYIVTGGVSAGDTIIVTGYQKVKPGMQVNTQPWKPDSQQQNRG